MKNTQTRSLESNWTNYCNKIFILQQLFRLKRFTTIKGQLWPLCCCVKAKTLRSTASLRSAAKSSILTTFLVASSQHSLSLFWSWIWDIMYSLLFISTCTSIQKTIRLKCIFSFLIKIIQYCINKEEILSLYENYM